MLKLSQDQVEQLRRRLAAKQLREEDFEIFSALLASHRQVNQWTREEDMTVDRLRELVLGTTSESSASNASPDSPTPCQEPPERTDA
jgi:hypothetical protein